MNKRQSTASICLIVFIAIIAVAITSIYPSHPSHAQDGGTAIGLPHPGQNDLEFIGRFEQADFSTAGYGYITYIAGLPSDLLFSEGTSPFFRDQSTARITYSVTAVGDSRSNYENIFLHTATGSLTLYYNETPVGATFDDPATFAQGTPIATFDLSFQTILNVQEPNVGVLYASIDATQISAPSFSLGGATYTLGQTDLLYHMTLFGQGFRSSVEPLAATYNIGGNAVLLP